MNVVLADNVAFTGYNFGELPIVIVPNNSISGFVYVDSNDNGVFDSGEQPISGVTVTLSGAASRTVTTGTDGSYQFTALSDGTYTIAQTQPSGFNDGKDTIGSPALGTLANDSFVGITLAGNNVQATNYNFGEQAIVIPPNNSLSGFVYIDANDNGIFDYGEQPISGVTVTLSGAASRTVTTGTDGSYQFTALADGTYTVTQTQPSGFNDGKDTIGSPALGTVNNDQFVGLTLAGNNVQAANYNFGERPIEIVPNNSIGGFVYVDANDNGTFDIGEQPISESQLLCRALLQRRLQQEPMVRISLRRWRMGLIRLLRLNRVDSTMARIRPARLLWEP